MRPLIPEWGGLNGGFVDRPVQQSSISRNAAFRFPRATARETRQPVLSLGSFEVTALSVEFVARPEEAHRLQSAIPAALSAALQEVSGFAGCLVLTSEQEARLVTVITLWVGDERLKQCRDNARWVHKLLAPYVDRCLRVQTLAAHSPALPVIGLEMDLDDQHSTGHCLTAEGETACVA